MNYEVIGQVKMKNGDKVPLLDIPMMSDERWNELAEQHAIKTISGRMERSLRTQKPPLSGNVNG